VVISRLLKFIRRQLRSGERFKSIAEGASVENKLVQTTACCTLVSHTNNCRPRARGRERETVRCVVQLPGEQLHRVPFRQNVERVHNITASFQRNYKNKQHEKRLLLLLRCANVSSSFAALRTRIGVGNWRGPKFGRRRPLPRSSISPAREPRQVIAVNNIKEEPRAKEI